MFMLKIATAGLLGMVAVTAMAQAPSMDMSNGNMSPGVRAGLNHGDRDSLPRSNKAGNISVADSKSNIASTLPSPSLGADATTRDYLKAARASLVAGRTGAAQQSLEMAETRSLGGSVVPARADAPNDTPMVTRIRNALQALGTGDRHQSIQLIDVALAN